MAGRAGRAYVLHPAVIGLTSAPRREARGASLAAEVVVRFNQRVVARRGDVLDDVLVRDRHGVVVDTLVFGIDLGPSASRLDPELGARRFEALDAVGVDHAGLRVVLTVGQLWDVLDGGCVSRRTHVQEGSVGGDGGPEPIVRLLSEHARTDRIVERRGTGRVEAAPDAVALEIPRVKAALRGAREREHTATPNVPAVESLAAEAILIGLWIAVDIVARAMLGIEEQGDHLQRPGEG